MTRRELFAALLAPLVAVKAIAAPRNTNAQAWMEDGHTFYSLDFVPRSSRTINQIPEFMKHVVRNMRSKQ